MLVNTHMQSAVTSAAIEAMINGFASLRAQTTENHALRFGAAKSSTQYSPAESAPQASLAETSAHVPLPAVFSAPMF